MLIKFFCLQSFPHEVEKGLFKVKENVENYSALQFFTISSIIDLSLLSFFIILSVLSIAYLIVE